MIAANRVWEVDKMWHAREEGIEVDVFKMNFRSINRVWEVDKMWHAREEGIEVDIFKVNFRSINQPVQMYE